MAMRVIEATEFGGPEVLVPVDSSDPVAGTGQVVVDAAVADTLFVDTQTRRGCGREHSTLQPPYVRGCGVAGGRVIAAARRRRKLDIVRTLGADVVVDYSGPDWPERVREATGGTGPDVVFDGAGGELGRAAFEITARGGRFSAHGGPSGGF